MKSLFIFILIISFILPQKTYTLTEDEVKSLYNKIQELEYENDLNKKVVVNLETQMKLYIKSDNLYKVQIAAYEKKLKLKEDMINLVKPKWYHNRYIWFGLGVSFTAGSVILAGQLN